MTNLDKQIIRTAFGHNGIECKVRIRKNGDIERHGSPDAFDRQHDFWAVVSTVDTEQTSGCLK